MDIKSILKQNNFNFNKAYGQNFLTDPMILDSIVELGGITSGDTVIEIGAGAGTLTRAISAVARRVVVFEIDRRLEPILQQTLAGCDNVTLVFVDIMKLSMTDIHRYVDNAPFKVVANIPYYITSPLLMMFVENSTLVESLTLTIQAEVADRLTASPSNKDYGALTVAVDIVADCTQVMELPRHLFLPPPNVDSAVVAVAMNRAKYDIADMELLRRVFKSGFAMRRKTLANNLMSAFSLSRETVVSLLERCHIPVGVRGEQLHSSQYVLLADNIAPLID